MSFPTITHPCGLLYRRTRWLHIIFVLVALARSGLCAGLPNQHSRRGLPAGTKAPPKPTPIVLWASFDPKLVNITEKNKDMVVSFFPQGNAGPRNFTLQAKVAPEQEGWMVKDKTANRIAGYKGFRIKVVTAVGAVELAAFTRPLNGLLPKAPGVSPLRGVRSNVQYTWTPKEQSDLIQACRKAQKDDKVNRFKLVFEFAYIFVQG